MTRFDWFWYIYQCLFSNFTPISLHMLKCSWAHTISCLFMYCSFADIGHADMCSTLYYYCYYYSGAILKTAVFPPCSVILQVPRLKFQRDMLVYLLHIYIWSEDGHLQFCLVSAARCNPSIARYSTATTQTISLWENRAWAVSFCVKMLVCMVW